MTIIPSDGTSRKRNFDQIQVGDEEELTHLLTKSDVQVFATLTGDFNPLHLDEAFARRTLFRKPVVYGMLSASFISTMIGMLLPGNGALWTGQTLEFLQPAFVGDTLRVVARVKHKSPATRALVLELVITNQYGHRLIVGRSTVKVLELKYEEKPLETEATKTVLVTGGSRGIGAATVRRLASEGHALVVNYVRSADEAEKVVAEVTQGGRRAISFQANIAREDEVKALFTAAENTFGPAQAVVHCAASASVLRPFDKLEWDAVQQQLDVQLKGAFNCAKAALPRMVEAKSGSLVFIGSIAADGVPPSLQTDYVVAKSALAALARCLAVEYGPKGIRVNVVAPGMTQTDMIAQLPEKAKLLTQMQTPLRRLAEPSDIADVVAFLLSPGARHITGETIRVCGGGVML
jgi:3-oxoacyl-[acyl-carrier protein] reductase